MNDQPPDDGEAYLPTIEELFGTDLAAYRALTAQQQARIARLEAQVAELTELTQGLVGALNDGLAVAGVHFDETTRRWRPIDPSKEQ